jgi:hypothetical protein
MGQVDATMAGAYHERVSDERLRKVSASVRSWRFGDKVTTPAEPAAAGLAEEFVHVFNILDAAANSHNFVSLVAVRRALPPVRSEFDAGLNELRRLGKFTLSAAEGRHGVSADEQKAGIMQDGMLLPYVSRHTMQ